MSASLAHEIKNPLTIVMANNKIIRRAIESGDHDKATKLLDKQLDACDRILQVLSGLTKYSRFSEDDFTDFELSALAKDTIAIVRAVFSSVGITIEENYRGYGECKIHYGQVQQVIMNLLKNAHDELLEGEERKILVETTNDRKSVYLSIEDSGRGIPVDKREKVFEQYYTTKPIGKGTGIGLAMCKNLVTNYGGEIYIENPKMLKGTRFTIRFPLAI